MSEHRSGHTWAQEAHRVVEQYYKYSAIEGNDQKIKEICSLNLLSLKDSMI